MTQAPPTASPHSPPGSDAVRLSLIERALSVVAPVRSGEGATALLLGAALFLLLMAYYIIKPVREALILQHPAGAEYKSWLGAAIAVLLLLVVPAYARIADRLPRNRLVAGVTLFFSVHLVLFYWASSMAGLRESVWLSLIFFVWVGIFNMMLVAQLWAFANDVYDQEQGKRLFVIVGLGASIGAIAGGAVQAALGSLFDIFEMLLVSAAALGGVALIAELVHRRENALRPSSVARANPAPLAPMGVGEGAFALVLRTRYLGLIAAFSLVFTFVNTNGEYMLGKLIKGAADSAIHSGALDPGQVRGFIAARYNAFFGWTNSLSFVLQFLVVSRLVQRAGVSRAFFILPVLALVSGLGVAAVPVLGVIFVGKIAENSADYSLNNTLRQMLWLPTSREMKYKAKQAVDTFFVRMGDVASGAWVALGAAALGLGVRGFALTNTVLVVAWLVLAWAIMRTYRELTAQAEADPEEEGAKP